jgi:hypothetical protein
MHYLACKAALAAAGGGDGAPDASAPPPGPDASAAPPMPPPGPDASAPPPAMKAEKGAEMPSDKKANGENPMDVVHKSEKAAAIASLTPPAKKTDKESALDSLSKSEKDGLAQLVTAVKNFVERPVRKSISSTSEIERPKTVDLASLSKNEIDTRLAKAIKRTDLSKDDRSAITQYGLKLVKVDAIKHLLTP